MTATNDLRAELLAAVEHLGQLLPEWRLGQTLANLAMTAGRMDASGVWELDDAEALDAARELIEQFIQVEPTRVAASSPSTPLFTPE